MTVTGQLKQVKHPEFFINVLKNYLVIQFGDQNDILPTSHFSLYGKITMYRTKTPFITSHFCLYFIAKRGA